MARDKEKKAAYDKVYGQKWRAKNLDKIKAKSRKLSSRYSQCRSRARRRGLSFEITLSEYEAIVLNALCNYCRGSLPEAGSGIDRVDSSQGYNINNIVPCCSTCNMMFGAQSKEEAYAHMQHMLDVRSQKLP